MLCANLIFIHVGEGRREEKGGEAEEGGEGKMGKKGERGG